MCVPVAQVASADMAYVDTAKLHGAEHKCKVAFALPYCPPNEVARVELRVKTSSPSSWKHKFNVEQIRGSTGWEIHTSDEGLPQYPSNKQKAPADYAQSQKLVLDLTLWSILFIFLKQT